MAKSNGAPARQPEPKTAPWAERQAAAYRSAKHENEIELLRPGEALLYHEGNLVIDIENDPSIAGRAAAFRDAT